MPSTWRNSWSSPKERVYYLPLGRDDEAVIQNMAKVIADRNGFTPVVIKDSDDTIGVVTVHDGPSLAPGEIIAPIVGGDPATPKPTTTTSRCPTGS